MFSALRGYPKKSGCGIAVLGAAAVMFFMLQPAHAFPIRAANGILPAGTDLNEDVINQLTELFKSEQAGGKRPYLLNLGDMAFSSPSILGGAAREAGMSCNTCHQNGTGNPALFVPGMSTRHGNFDTTGPLFFAKANNGVLDPVRMPSLRGARYLAPYGHDGRFSSLRDFARNVIVNEFSGPEPSPAVLDGIVSYIQEIQFLPNPRLLAGGHLASSASAAERHGEALFNAPFPHDASLSCAACHTPSAAFTDHQQHDVGSGGLFKTPTLINANFNGPYFHDARFDTYDLVVAHFNGQFRLGLSDRDQKDLVAYLHAVGDGENPYSAATVASELTEISDFASVLDTAIPQHDDPIIALTVETVGLELRELGEEFPERGDTSVSGGVAERLNATRAIRGLVLQLRQIDMARVAGNFDDAGTLYADFKRDFAAATPVLQAAEPWSLFNPAIHDRHFTELKRLADASLPMH